MEDTKAQTLLSLAAHKAALRLSQLPDGRTYNITLTKLGERWILVVADEKGRKAEVCK